MKNFLKNNGIYFLMYLGMLCFLGYILLYNGKVQIHRAMNAYVGNEFFNEFFKYITHLGDGIVAFLVAVMLAFFSVRKSAYILLSYFGAAALSSFLKHMVFPDIYRPHFVFQYFVREKLKEVDGLELMGFNSFPSGHSLSAFALFFCLLLMTKNQFLKMLYFVLALLAAYSRVYLSEHWLIDVYVGSIIGVSFSLFFYVVFYQTDKWSQLNTSLPELLFNKKSKGV